MVLRRYRGWFAGLALVFALVQFAALVHTARHGFVDHDHHGQPCAMYAYCEHMVLASGPAAVFLPLILLLVVAPLALPRASIVAAVPAAARPRAPPPLA